MKILDRYILTTFLKTFFPLFIIIMFILLLQTIWLFISELAGKDLDFSVIIKFLTFATPRLIPMVLPLTVLLTSIMIFGSFAENYEFAAMKSSGISLQRAMRTLSVFIFFVGIGAFFFSNTVIPSSEKKFINLRKNIVKVKPAMVITPNQFNDLGDINIKVSEKYGDNDQFLKDVIIHKRAARPGNFTVIKAIDGELQGSVNSDLITLILNDGNYYDEIQQRSPQRRNKLPFAKTHFKKYILNIDLSSLGSVDMDAQQYSKGYNMLNVNGLKNEIDTLSMQVNEEIKTLGVEIDRRIGFEGLNKNMKIDSIQDIRKDTLDIMDHFDAKKKIQIYVSAISNTEGVVRKINTLNERNVRTKRALNKYEMSLHNKYALGIACIILFFVGAPLGAIIRKGGMGLPIVIGVVLFLTYHFIGIFAKNSAEEGGIPPFLGSWLSTFVIFPLSIYLTLRATADRGIFSFDNFVQPIRDFFAKRSSKI
ncbi:LptF/LptG family permease [Aquimarina celericrescens]|uniref:LptF/LptG family permease n=1 Tax=Aquimarina celericrescens TaxID=1964542 RepID=A0ABW5ATP6_9FLAO|nr:LptF/LptG family permease [Aquimarina celericrescens]